MGRCAVRRRGPQGLVQDRNRVYRLGFLIPTPRDRPSIDPHFLTSCALAAFSVPRRTGLLATGARRSLGPPVTLGNMRELGVHHLIGYCRNDTSECDRRPTHSRYAYALRYVSH